MLDKYLRNLPQYKGTRLATGETAPPIRPMRVTVAEQHSVAGQRELRVVSEVAGQKIEHLIETDNPGRFKPGEELVFTWKGAKAGKGGRVISKGTLESAKAGPSTKEPRGEGGEEAGTAGSEDKKKKDSPEPSSGSGTATVSGVPGDGEGEVFESAEEEVLSALAAIDTSSSASERGGRRARPETRPTEEVTLLFNRKEKFSTILPNGESVFVSAHGALPGDVVSIAKLPDSSMYEVVNVVKRHPHTLVGTARIVDPGSGSLHHSFDYENQEDYVEPAEVDAERGAVMFYPDSLAFQIEPFRLGMKVPEVSADKEMKLKLRRAADPTEEEWVLEEVLGVAGEPRDEIEAIAKRTRNGAKKVEDLTDDDLKAFAEELDEYPELAAELEGITMAEVRAQLRELEELNEQLRSKQVSTEALVARFLSSPPNGITALGNFGAHWKEGFPGDDEPNLEKVLVGSFEAYRHGENRMDFREVPTFTIDPETAKDFDDALSCRIIRDAEGRETGVEIGVHIADPSAFIPQGSPLDILARFRQKTQYLRTLTLPVFPHVLSDELCSLNQDEDKLAFSTVFTFPPRDSWSSSDAPPQPEVWHGRTVIRSDKRFTYEEAQKILTEGSGQYHEELAMTKLLADAYRTERAEKGVTEMTSENELEFIIDPITLRPTGVKSNVRLDSMRLIEQWMIRANKAVSTSLAEKGLVFQRYHPPPSPKKLFAAFEKIGFSNLVPPEEEWETADLRVLLKAADDRIKKAPQREQRDMEAALLSVMERAGYALVSTEELDSGMFDHFGLSLERYSHYTSPIRRYPDIATHLLLDALLSGEPVTRENPKYATLVARLEESARIINDIERDLDHNEDDAREVLGLYLLKSGTPEGVVHTVRARVKRADSRGLALQFPLPGGGVWEFWVRRKSIVEQDYGGELSKDDWRKFREGEEYEFNVEDIDVSLRKMTLSYNPRAAAFAAEAARVARINAEEKARFDALEGGEDLGLVVESAEVDGSILVTLLHKKTRVAHAYELTQDRVLAPGGGPLSDADWRLLRPPVGVTGDVEIRTGVRLRRAGDQVSFELLRLPERPVRKNPFEGFAQSYLNKEVVAEVSDIDGSEVVVNFMTKPRISGYRIPRSYFEKVPPKVWERVKVKHVIVFKVVGVDTAKKELALNWITDRPPRDKKEGRGKPRTPRGDGGGRNEKKRDGGSGDRPRPPRGDGKQREGRRDRSERGDTKK